MRAESRASATEFKSLRAIADQLENKVPEELEDKTNTMEDLIHTVVHIILPVFYRCI